MARFSIIIPVMNGGEYIKECVSSILSQTVTDFNLHILDSGSTDGTTEWIKALIDPRIILYSTSSPLSIEQNWSRIKTIPRNEWMTIIGCDDKLYPHYLQVMASLITCYEDASLYGTHFDFIDSNGSIIKKSRHMSRKQLPREFSEKIITNDIDVVSMMMRSADYDRIGGIPEYPGLLFADYVLWIELARLSYVAVSPENCLSYRIHKKSSTSLSNDETYYKSYDLYIQYLYFLKNLDLQFLSVINKISKRFLRNRCIEFTNKLIQRPKNNRQTFKTVAALAEKHTEYANLLVDDNLYNPTAEVRIRIAQIIDSNLLFRIFYLVIKKIKARIKS